MGSEITLGIPHEGQISINSASKIQSHIQQVHRENRPRLSWQHQKGIHRAERGWCRSIVYDIIKRVHRDGFGGVDGNDGES